MDENRKEGILPHIKHAGLVTLVTAGLIATSFTLGAGVRYASSLLREDSSVSREGYVPREIQGYISR